MEQTEVKIRDLLMRGPVMGSLHPLWALCLPSETIVEDNAARVAERLDNLDPHSVHPIWITDVEMDLAPRFFRADADTVPSAEIVNHVLPHRVDHARSHLLTHRRVANRIVEDVRMNRYQSVIFLLVDGLSYWDVLDWPEVVEPCFIDGPSITFYEDKSTKQPLKDVGFPAIVGNPGLARRLSDLGLQYSRGFSYWSRESNVVSDYLFQGVPLTRVTNFQEVLARLHDKDVSQTYIQIVREGLDGLAHHRRELTAAEIKETVRAIRQDALALAEILHDQGRSAALFLTSDHGILWKTDHPFTLLKTGDRVHPRYGTFPPATSDATTAFVLDEQEFYVYHWPYLGSNIRWNDSGVHGGLSAHESIVPFIRWEFHL